MGFTVFGRLHAVFDTKQVTEKFQKREFVVEIIDNPHHPQLVLFQLTGNRCDDIAGLNVGDDVTVEFSLRGRAWENPSGEVKYFNSLEVWRIEQDGAPRRDDPSPPFGEIPPPGDDDIPF